MEVQRVALPLHPGANGETHGSATFAGGDLRDLFLGGVMWIARTDSTRLDAVMCGSPFFVAPPEGVLDSLFEARTHTFLRLFVCGERWRGVSSLGPVVAQRCVDTNCDFGGFPVASGGTSGGAGAMASLFSEVPCLEKERCLGRAFELRGVDRSCCSE